MTTGPTIMVINPNTTESMSRVVATAARQVARAGTTIVASTATSGVASVESHADEVWAAAAVLDQIAAGEARGIDGYVIACFGDTGLPGAKELAAGPVVGMTEAALCTAALIAARFTVVTMPRRTLEQSHRVVRQLGLQHRCSVRAVDVPVSDAVEDAAALVEIFTAEARVALREDDAEALVLGCAGLSELVDPLQRLLRMPVIDGVLAGVTQVEGLLAQGLSTSRVNTFASPPTAPAPLPRDPS